MFEKKSRRIPLESLQVQTLSGRKRSNLTGKVRTEIFHGVLPGTMHQNKTFEFKRGEIGCGAFKSIFTGVPQVKPADDGANDLGCEPAAQNLPQTAQLRLWSGIKKKEHKC